MSASPFDLSGRVALVTGSSRGIGLALARALGNAGAELIVNARDQVALDSAAEVLRSEGLTVHVRAFDVCDPVAVVDAVDSFERDIGPIDVLVNNAGFQKRGAVLDYDVDDFRRIIDVNLVSAFTVAKAVAGHMVRTRSRKDRQRLLGDVRGRPTDGRCVQRHEGWIEDADPRDVC